MTGTYLQSVGRRKSAIVHARFYPVGTGKITVNGVDFNDYFNTDRTRMLALASLKESGKLESVDIAMKAVGGGKVGQADAVRLAIARALVAMEEANRLVMRAHGFLTRDARIKERKKFGKRGARRSSQWRKR